MLVVVELCQAKYKVNIELELVITGLIGASTGTPRPIRFLTLSRFPMHKYLSNTNLFYTSHYTFPHCTRHSLVILVELSRIDYLLFCLFHFKANRTKILFCLFYYCVYNPRAKSYKLDEFNTTSNCRTKKTRIYFINRP